MTTETTTIVIPVNRDKEGIERITHTLRLSGTMDRFGLGCVLRGEESRRVYQGPKEPGPWAYAYGLATVIDNYGGSGKESADALQAGREHWITIGEILEIDGSLYRIRSAPNRNIELEKIATAPPN